MKKTFMLALVLMFGICALGITTAIAGDYCPKGYGTGTPGYWKNHPEAWGDVESIFIGGKEYTKAQAIAIMDGPVAGNKWVTLFKAYVAAVLNVDQNENCTPCCYWKGDDCGINLHTSGIWLDDFQGKKVRASSDAWQNSHGEAEYFCLDEYNNGNLWMAISRDDLE